MSNLENKLNGMKQQYREIFMKSSDAILQRVEEIRPENFEGDIFDKFAPNSNVLSGRWQF